MNKLANIDIIDDNVKIRTDKDNRVILKLKGERRRRNIGRIFVEDGINIYRKDEKYSDRFKKSDAFSLPFALVKELNPEDAVNVRLFKGFTRVGIYWLTIKEIQALLDKGAAEFLFFKGSGIERKIYIKRELWHFEE